MKRLYALMERGKINKSATIKEVLDRLKKYPSSKVIDEPPLKDKDVTAILSIPDLGLVGIESQGDPGSRLGDSLDYFVKQGCDIIICATRTRGGLII